MTAHAARIFPKLTWIKSIQALRNYSSFTSCNIGPAAIAGETWRSEVTALHPSKIKELESRLNEDLTSILEKLREHIGGADEPGEPALAGRMQAVDDPAIADLINDIDIAVLEHELAELRAVRAALQRIRSGTYGICLDCGEDIPAERLNARPDAQYCLGCQEKFERRHDAAHPPLP